MRDFQCYIGIEMVVLTLTVKTDSIPDSSSKIKI